jgi:hypothetical protein
MKTIILGLAAAALFGTAAAAQGWRGDYSAQRYGGWDYPEFRGEVAHIRSEVRQGLNQGWLDYDQAREMNGELRDVQRREASEYRFHGWRLPDDDRQAIRAQLDRLDHEIDQARDNGDNGYEGDNGYNAWNH